MLVEKEDIFPLLRCPRSGVFLRAIDRKLIAELDTQCIEYKIIDGYPVLIDFDKSVLTEDGVKTLSSAVERRSYGKVSGAIRRLISPPLETTTENVKHLLALLFASRDRASILVIGGGTVGQGMESLYNDPHIALVSFDIYSSPSVQFIADAHSIPLQDSSFDAVIIQAVLEHVLDPGRVVSEIHRVLKLDGIVYAETPFLQHVHEGAYDFTRFTESGHRYLFKQFEAISSGASAGAGTQLLWSLEHFFRGLFRSRKAGKVVKLCFFGCNTAID
ncbi:class I SAM-dependent methyltransferase [Rubidibacter lacunae]|uniref:class I SAM-dependent methyltransferase n=1 Tax=Rubidibacter lacunae TaxID=582514 RepID=UPI00041F976A|nr:class I SAM-dependent methyltransferase [Rubidibacter lacunae]